LEEAVVCHEQQTEATTRMAEVVEMDTKLVEGKIVQFRAKVRLSFKHEVEPETL
jgi:flavin-binding protein dodecin